MSLAAPAVVGGLAAVGSGVAGLGGAGVAVGGTHGPHERHWTYNFGSVSGPPTLGTQAFGGLERDRSASENGTIALSDVLSLIMFILSLI